MEKKFIITDQQRHLIITTLLEMQAKYSYQAIQILGALPEVSPEGHIPESQNNILPGV